MGVKTVGEKFVELIRNTGGRVPETRPSKETLDSIHRYLISRSGGMICEEQWEFLKEILRAEKYSSRAIHLFGGNEFIAEQDNGALDELPADSAFVQFAYWDGDSGGDAWVLDLKYDMIRCVNANLMGTQPMSEVRAFSYGAFPQAEWFFAFIHGVADQSGWIKK